MDLVNDRVFSRALNPAIMATLFATIMTLFLKLTLIIPVPQPEVQAFTLSYLPGFPVTVGDPSSFKIPMAVRLSNTEKFGIPNKTVVVSIQAIKATTLPGYDYMKMFATGIISDSNFLIDLCENWGTGTLEDFRTTKMCTPDLSVNGSRVVSDSDGVANFTEIYFEHAHPGTYELKFACEPLADCNNMYDTVKVVVKSDVRALKMLGTVQQLKPIPEGEEKQGTAWTDTPKVQITLNNGSYAVGRKVVAFSMGSLSSIPLEENYKNPIYPGITKIGNDMMQAVDSNKLTVFDGDIAYTDANGIATFPALTPSGFAGTNTYTILGLYCEGRITYIHEQTPTSLTHLVKAYAVSLSAFSFMFALS